MKSSQFCHRSVTIGLYLLICAMQFEFPTYENKIDTGVSSKSEDDDDDESAPLMILEYMPYGDLQGFLESHKYILYYNASLICLTHVSVP